METRFKPQPQRSTVKKITALILEAADFLPDTQHFSLLYMEKIDNLDVKVYDTSGDTLSTVKGFNLRLHGDKLFSDHDQRQIDDCIKWLNDLIAF